MCKFICITVLNDALRRERRPYKHCDFDFLTIIYIDVEHWSCKPTFITKRPVIVQLLGHAEVYEGHDSNPSHTGSALYS